MRDNGGTEMFGLTMSANMKIIDEEIFAGILGLAGMNMTVKGESLMPRWIVTCQQVPELFRIGTNGRDSLVKGTKRGDETLISMW